MADVDPPDRLGERRVGGRRAPIGRLPAARPGHLTAHEWAAVTGVVAGKTYAEVAADLGLSRQRVHQLVAQARAKLEP